MCLIEIMGLAEYAEKENVEKGNIERKNRNTSKRRM
jgi:hypothetical protein